MFFFPAFRIFLGESPVKVSSLSYREALLKLDSWAQTGCLWLQLTEPRIGEARPSPRAHAVRGDYRVCRDKRLLLRSILNVLYGLEGGS